MILSHQFSLHFSLVSGEEGEGEGERRGKGGRGEVRLRENNRQRIIM